MKTYQEAINENTKKFQDENNRIESFYSILKNNPFLKHGKKFWLWDGHFYELCVYLGYDDDGYCHFYSSYVKGKKFYRDSECWQLELMLKEGCSIEPYDKKSRK